MDDVQFGYTPAGGVPSRSQFSIGQTAAARGQDVAGKVQAARRVGLAFEANGKTIPWRAHGVEHIGLNDDIGQRWVVCLLAVVEPKRRALVPPDPVRVAVAEVGDDVVGNDRTAVGVFRAGRDARH